MLVARKQEIGNRGINTKRRRRDSNLQSNPLEVPKIVCSLFTSHNFDRYANSHSLFPPLAAVVFLARAFVARVRVLTTSQNKKDTLLGVFFIWRREWDSNPRYVAVRRFSRPFRYNHFGTSAIITGDIITHTI